MNATRVLLVGAVALSSLASAQTVRVRVLERHHPRQLELSGPSRHSLLASGSTLEVDGVAVPQPYALPEAVWQLELPGEGARHYHGSLLVRAVAGELSLVVTFPLERYVAQVVAAETTPGTPEEALRAQAVVARSFLLAQGPRHPEADVCDLAHCQLLLGAGVPAAHRAAARAAAKATRGQVLVLGDGTIAETPFHAACGGHTGKPEEVFGSLATGAAAVEDSGCPVQPWEARVPLSLFRAALGALLGTPGAPLLTPEALVSLLGEGGYVLRVLAPPGRSASGDAVARALDRALGWGAVRSGRFQLVADGEVVRVRGTGLGHGLGLCQAGAALRAARGDSYQSILRHYFPLASLR